DRRHHGPSRAAAQRSRSLPDDADGKTAGLCAGPAPRVLRSTCRSTDRPHRGRRELSLVVVDSWNRQQSAFPDAGILMTLLTAKPLARPTVLRGLGAALSLPVLDAMTPAVARAAAPVRRFQTFYVPNGMAMEYWLPKTGGARFPLTPILEPLAPYRDQMLVLSGLKANWNYIHAGASGSFLTG